MTKAALDSNKGGAVGARFSTIVPTAEPLGTAARSIERKIFSRSPTIFLNSGTYGLPNHLRLSIAANRSAVAGGPAQACGG
jgi:hypothetical protein